MVAALPHDAAEPPQRRRLVPALAEPRDLDQTLGEWTDDDGVVCPMQTWLVTARR